MSKTLIIAEKPSVAGDIARALGVKLKPVYTLKEVFGYAACNLAVPDADIKRLGDALQRMRADGSHDRLLAPYR